MNPTNLSIPKTAVIGIVVFCVIVAGAAVFATVQVFSLMDQLDRTETQLIQEKQARQADQKTQMAALRKQLEAKDAALVNLEESLRPAPSDEDSPAENSPPPEGSRRGPGPTSGVSSNQVSWWDRMRTEDPERYKQMQEERDRRRKQMDEWFAGQITWLDQRAQTAQTQRETEVTTALANTLARMNEVQQQFRAARELPDDQRRDVMQKLGEESHDLSRTLSKLREMDRDVQLENLARSAGYTDPQAAQNFAKSVRNIYKNTEYNVEGVSSHRHGGPPGGR